MLYNNLRADSYADALPGDSLSPGALLCLVIATSGNIDGRDDRHCENVETNDDHRNTPYFSVISVIT
jgi:hypothetical protein